MTALLADLVATVLVASVRATLLVLLAALVLARVPASSAVRALVWRLTFVVVLLLPVVPPLLVIEMSALSRLVGVAVDVARGAAVPLPASDAGELASGRPGSSLLGGVWHVIASASGLLGLIWLAGAATMLARSAVGWWSAVRVAHRGTAADDAWQALARTIAAELGAGPAPRVMRSERVPAPALLGVPHRIVLVPLGADAWPLPHRRVVLVHEIAHLRRGDAQGALLERVVCAIHWFNPVVRRAARWSRAECERACDDQVLATGVDPHDYAARLVDTAAAPTGGTRLIAASTLPLAHDVAQLEARLLALIDAQTLRGDPSIAQRVVLTGSVLVVALAVGVVGLRPVEARGGARMQISVVRGAELVVQMPGGATLEATGGPFEITADTPVRHEWSGDTLRLVPADAARPPGRVELRSGSVAVGAVVRQRRDARGAGPAGSEPTATRVRMGRSRAGSPP